eukprot:CAMPEP_0197030284 /NCGR_PEP_ID=MMETSP1384-20130603/9547_1 /TAXON_ID=29189 /ORGANISM="Ammonia sp." /LENGTH=619 /DNA_ID=CAMNT_0042459599 /DNA_START=29 /DNA_END=1888 /DNA_ORIENTATION=-
MALVAMEHKDMSEREELLSDANDLNDHDAPHDFGQIHGDDVAKPAAHGDDPLVKAALNVHEKQQQVHEEHAQPVEQVADLNLPMLDKNVFQIPVAENEIKCGISWSFVDEQKLIDLDLIVTALNTYSFEMGSVNKDHKKMFKKCIVYNKHRKHKHNKDDKSIDFRLDAIPADCHSLWFRINAYSGDSLQDVDKATFNIYSRSNEDDSSEEEEEEEDGREQDERNELHVQQREREKKNVLYSYDIGLGYDCGAMLLGILYRSSSNKEEWQWTVVEEKNLYSQLIVNNLRLIYDEKIVQQRPHDRNTRMVLSEGGERYIMDANIEKIQVGLGWQFTSPFEDEEEEAAAAVEQEKMIEPDKKEKRKQQQKLGGGGDEIDIDVDGSIMVFSKVEQEENEKGVLEETCEHLDTVNNNNGFYKTYVVYINTENYEQELKQQKEANQKKKKKKKKRNDDEDDDDDEEEELEEEEEQLQQQERRNEEELIVDDELFDVYISKMNGDNNDIGSLCILLNIFNDNNLQNKSKTNNIESCYLRLIDVDNDRKELCRFTVNEVNADKKTSALVLSHLSKLENGCWCLATNDAPLKNNSKLDYPEYAKQVVMRRYSQKNVANRDACCACAIL